MWFCAMPPYASDTLHSPPVEFCTRRTSIVPLWPNHRPCLHGALFCVRVKQGGGVIYDLAERHIPNHMCLSNGPGDTNHVTCQHTRHPTWGTHCTLLVPRCRLPQGPLAARRRGPRGHAERPGGPRPPARHLIYIRKGSGRIRSQGGWAHSPGPVPYHHRHPPLKPTNPPPNPGAEGRPAAPTSASTSLPGWARVPPTRPGGGLSLATGPLCGVALARFSLERMNCPSHLCP